MESALINHTGSLRVLVADGDVDACQSTALLLRSRGHNVHPSFSGRDAIREVAEFKPEFLLLDTTMPGVDGLNVARVVRQLDLPAQPIMAAMSGHTTLYHKHLCAKAGFDHFLLKPVAPPALEQLLRMVAEGQPLRERLSLVRNEYRIATYELAESQIEFVSVLLDLAENLNEEQRQRCHMKVRRLQARIARWLNQQSVCSPEQKATLQSLLDALHGRMTVIGGGTDPLP